MTPEMMHTKQQAPHRDRRQRDRRVVLRRTEDMMEEQQKDAKRRRLQSFLELGQVIGLDLNLDEMLLQIARKATQVMEADRFSIFLFDPETDELWTKVAVGLDGKEIRIPSRTGVAGYCFHTGQTVNIGDVYADDRFCREVDQRTHYRTKTMLSIPFYSRNGQALGVIQLINKRDGVFTYEDEVFLRTFNNHSAVFIEMAQLQRARMEALEQSRAELDRLNRAKGKALDHLSHELRTPLGIIQGVVRLLKRRLDKTGRSAGLDSLFEALDRNLARLFQTQMQTDKIMRTYREIIEGVGVADEFDRLWKRVEDHPNMPSEMRLLYDALRRCLLTHLPRSAACLQPISLLSFVQRALSEIAGQAGHRDISYKVTGDESLHVLCDPAILRDVITALLKNGIENTPDEGTIRVAVAGQNGKVLLEVEDFGIGITEENMKEIFEGLFHTQDADLYASKKPYDFYAGGKGLDLLFVRIYGERFGFHLSAESKRCIYIPSDKDLCPGRISLCPYCETREACFASGGSTFRILFPAEEQKNKSGGKDHFGSSPLTGGQHG
jgi:signal transduction histidine kinase